MTRADPLLVRLLAQKRVGGAVRVGGVEPATTEPTAREKFAALERHRAAERMFWGWTAALSAGLLVGAWVLKTNLMRGTP